MTEIAIEGENVDVLATEMKSCLESILNLINTIKEELDCDNENHIKFAIYASSELVFVINSFISNINKVKRKLFGVECEVASLH